ncbi:MAG: ABC transporter ATP-binding protein [Candidatus Lokiarchaeia archaeon]
MSILILENIHKRFDEDWILEGINIETNDNEFLVLLGPSGCGKTTLLKIIAGLLKPTNGDVYINDQKITNIDPQKRDISMIFQNYPVYPHLDVYKNLALPLKLKKMPKKKMHAEVAKIAKKLNINHILNRATENLSGGELQRVAIGKALIKKPKIFLMDEPLSDLDAHIKILVKEMIKKIHEEEKKLFLYVTHNQAEAISQADRIAVLHDKKIVQLDAPDTIYNQPNDLFVAEFIGYPKINVFKCEIIEDSSRLLLSTPIGKIDISTKRDSLSNYQKKRVIVGIRPERLRIVEDVGKSFSNILSGSVKYSEFLGNQYIIWIKELNNFKILQGGLNRIRPNTKLNILVDLDSILLFDCDTRVRI